MIQSGVSTTNSTSLHRAIRLALYPDPLLAQVFPASTFVDQIEQAARWLRGNNNKWVHGGAADSEPMLGSGDIQSLADLGNSFSVISETRLVPFRLKDLARLAAATAVPLLPLGLTIFSLEELTIRLIKILL